MSIPEPLRFDYEAQSWTWLDVAREHENWADVTARYDYWADLRGVVIYALPPTRATLPYDLELAVVGGTPPYTIELTAGELPTGLELVDGVIQGVPAEPTYASFQLRVTDDAGASDTGLFSLVVGAPPPPAPIPPPPPTPSPLLWLAIDGGPELVLSDAYGGPGLEMCHITEVDYGYPEPREISDPRPLADGMIDQTEHFGSRVVTLTGKVAIDWESRGRRQVLMNALAPFLMPGARPWLYSRFDDGQVKRILLRADQFSRPQIANVQDISLSYKSPTGVLEDAELSIIRMIPEVPIAGRVYDLIHPRIYPEGTGTAWLATNRGNAPAEWIARIFGPCEGPAIENVTTGEAVDLAGLTLNAEQFVEVSTRDHTVLADGLPENSRWHTVDYVATTWWHLPPGESALRFHCHTWERPAVVVFTWRHTNLL